VETAQNDQPPGTPFGNLDWQWHDGGMATDERSGMEILDDSQCWKYLESQELGRLAVSVGAHPDIFPINYVVHRRRLLFKTAEGSKLASLAVNEAVAFEIDGYEADTNTVWSVVIQGHSRIVENDDESVLLEELPLVPWNLSEKSNFVEISASFLAGRRFVAEGRHTD
jgi:nitroimidazol reductase NimA-like FMN-containing flavoprotein (pyridoxamine 5'-phosphate oxidase superfamily)